MFIAPLLLLNLTVIVGPSVAGLAVAFTDWSGIGAMEFIGVANFQRLWQDDVFYKALTNNIDLDADLPDRAGFVGAVGCLHAHRCQTRADAATCHLLHPVCDGSRGECPVLAFPDAPRGSDLVPGWLNTASPSSTIPGSGRRATALYAVAFMDNWHFWGFLLVIYLAAMSAVDIELYEVARLDGASRFQQFRYVTLPSIRPTLVFTLLMITIWSGLVFDYVYITTGGGPANASEVMGTFLYSNAFERFEAGYAASIGVIMTLWVAMAVGGFVFLRRRGWDI